MTIKHFFTSEEPQRLGEYILQGVNGLATFNAEMGVPHHEGFVDVAIVIDGKAYYVKLQGEQMPDDIERPN